MTKKQRFLALIQGFICGLMCRHMTLEINWKIDKNVSSLSPHSVHFTCVFVHNMNRKNCRDHVSNPRPPPRPNTDALDRSATVDRLYDESRNKQFQKISIIKGTLQ